MTQFSMITFTFRDFTIPWGIEVQVAMCKARRMRMLRRALK